MRVCVLADIHGNAAPLAAAREGIVAERADVNLFLGDLCGYYYDQGETLEILRSLPNLVAIRGNHDAMFLRILDGDDELRRSYCQQFGLSMEHLLASDAVESVAAWLNSLPTSWSQAGIDVAAFHGSPWEPLDGYVYPDSPLERFAECEGGVIFLGHTHHPMVRSLGDKLIVNPGSLGQPRQGGWPTYAVVDLQTREVSLRPVEYDVAALRARIREAGDRNPYLQAVLERIRR